MVISGWCASKGDVDVVVIVCANKHSEGEKGGIADASWLSRTLAQRESKLFSLL